MYSGRMSAQISKDTDRAYQLLITRRYHYSKYPAMETLRVRFFLEFGIAKKVRSHTGPAILCEESRVQAPHDYSNVAESDWKGWKVCVNRKDARGISEAPAEDRSVRTKHISKELPCYDTRDSRGIPRDSCFWKTKTKTKLLELINRTTIDEMRKYDRTSKAKMKKHLDTMLNVWLLHIERPLLCSI